MRTIELFSGTKSFSKVMQKHGHETCTIDNNPLLQPDLVGDVSQLKYDLCDKKIDILWASPPCTAFSVASIGYHWTGGKCAYVPKTQFAKDSQELILRTLKFIQASHPTWWFIENPRGVLRKLSFMQPLEKFRHTISYCQYGDTRMKPTDIWTNAVWWKPRPICKNGDKCHTPAPRGSKTGTQGLKNAKERGVIPPELFEEILQHYETRS